VSIALRIAIADDEPAMLRDFRETLVELGHDIVCLATTGRELVTKCRDLRPDLVITDIKMPDMDGLEAAAEIRQEHPVPVVVVSAYHDRKFIERALENHVLAYLSKPVKQADLETAIVLVMRRFQEFQLLRREADDLRQALADRKVIERAKGILVKQANLDEEEAFRRLQDLASTKHQKMVQIAQAILITHEAMYPGRKA
jgi:response regulator NasT